MNTDIRNIFSEDIIGSGIDKSIFEAVNNMKKTLLEKISNNQASEEELAVSIKELIDDTFKSFTQAVIDFQRSEFNQMK